MTPDIPYNRKVVDPMECIRRGWQIVKPNYWLFVGMVFISMLIGSAVPLGILLGPMMCGLYLTLFASRRREPIEFGMLFKGFEYFAPALIAALLHVIPIIIIIVPLYLFMYLSMFVTIAVQGDDPSPVGFLAVMGTFAVILIVIFVVITVLSVGFVFAYPLIVDKKLQGFDAVKVSFKGALGNFWRLLAMMLLTSLLGVLGVAVCYVGVFLVFPITYGAIAAAYEQVYGLGNGEAYAANPPPPPPTFE